LLFVAVIIIVGKFCWKVFVAVLPTWLSLSTNDTIFCLNFLLCWLVIWCLGLQAQTIAEWGQNMQMAEIRVPASNVLLIWQSGQKWPESEQNIPWYWNSDQNAQLRSKLTWNKIHWYWKLSPIQFSTFHHCFTFLISVRVILVETHSRLRLNEKIWESWICMGFAFNYFERF